MTTNNFENVLQCLPNVQDSSSQLKLLIEIRKQIFPTYKANITKLQEKGSLKQIISSLQTSKKAIIDVALSILGNCSLDSKCARDAVCQFNVLSSLNQVLKRYPKEDSINGRVFRTIGNICQHRDQWATVIIDKKPQLIIQTVAFLKYAAEAEESEKISEATITMGVRSLREMLNKETLKPLVKTYGVLKVVGTLLIKYSIIWQETKKNQSVLVHIIKLLQEYSRYKYYPSILEMRNTEKGDSIVYLSKILLVAPKQIVKIVMNFLKMNELKSDLPISAIFDAFIQVLRDDTIIKEFNGTCEECMKCVCHLLDHPANRKNERCIESIPILIKILDSLTLQTSNKIQCCILIVSTLNKCKFNEELILEQIKCNILNVITDKLKEIVGTAEILSIPHKSDMKRKCEFVSRSGKEKRICSTTDLVDEKERSSSSSDSEIDNFYSSGMRFDFSPASSNESELGMSWTSGLSPLSSPRSQLYGMSESDSDDYSPVCSEVDNNDFPLPNLEEDESPDGGFDNNLGDPVEDIDDIRDCDDDSGALKLIKLKLVTDFVDLLRTYTRLRPLVLQLGKPELLQKLIKSSGYFDVPQMTWVMVDILDIILESHDYLIPLMQSDFIPTAYDLGKVQHSSSCSKCRRFQWISGTVIRTLTKVAESGVGKGEIAHKLLRGDSVTKQQLVLVIPYIVRNRTLLVKLMMNCGGLEILMKLLQDTSDQHEKSIKALCLLATRRLCIPNPKFVSSTCQSQECVAESEDLTKTVTFKLDDGSLITANRELLSRTSDFFCRLLNGSFKESNEDIISLSNVSTKSFTYLMQLIGCNLRTEKFDASLDLNTHLDVIVLCDRFLMQDYCVYLTDCVEAYRLTPDTIPIIYRWSLESRTNLLRVECIAFALVTNIKDVDRFKMFKQLFDLGYTEELVEDIRKLLVRYMTLSHFSTCRRKKSGFCVKNIITFC